MSITFPTLSKNLISVRKFSRENHVSIEFDPNGFSLKDLYTKAHLTRCNSPGDLYLFPPNPSSSSSPVDLHTVSPTTWHNRLGHLRSAVFDFLSSHLFPFCDKLKNHKSCNACSLGKHCPLRFSVSHSITYSPFESIHVDLCTSPIASKIGHKYYLVLLDDFSHFIWTFPLQTKSQVFSIFSQFHKNIQTQFQKQLKPYSVIMGLNSTTTPFINFASHMEWNFDYLPIYIPSKWKSRASYLYYQHHDSYKPYLNFYPSFLLELCSFSLHYFF